MSSPQIVDGKKLEDQALNPKGHAPIKPWTHCYTKTRYLLRLGRFKRTKYPFTAIQLSKCILTALLRYNNIRLP